MGLVWEPSEILARTVGDGVKKMMKKRERERTDRGVLVYIYRIFAHIRRTRI